MNTTIVPRVVVETTTTKTHTLELNREHLLALLRGDNFTCGADAEVYVEVPGGGDWSSERLEIDRAPVVVRWTERMS